MKVSSKRFVEKRVEKKEQVAKALRSVRIAEAKLRIAKKALKEAEIERLTPIEASILEIVVEEQKGNVTGGQPLVADLYETMDYLEDSGTFDSPEELEAIENFYRIGGTKFVQKAKLADPESFAELEAEFAALR